MLNMSIRTEIILSGIFGFLGVALGAFGAHSFKNALLELGTLESYKTGIEYHLIHAVVLLAIAISGRYEFASAYLFILIGIILFSFSLYFYALLKIKFFVFITPIGGVSFLIGWALIVWEALKLKI